MKIYLQWFLIFFFLNYSSQAQINLNNGLVAYLPFNGNTNDVSGNAHHGFVQNGALLTSDRFGNPNSAFLLDGINDYISIADPALSFSSVPFSVVIWFQTRTTNLQVLLGKRNFGPTNGQQFQISMLWPGAVKLGSSVTYNTIPCAGDLTENVLSRTNSSEPFCLEKWHCVIVTFGNNQHKMYLDGRLVSQNTPAFNNMLQCNSDIRLGNWWSGDPLWFNGKVDDFRWYNRVLNNEEISALSRQDNLAGIDFVYTQDLCSPLTLNFKNYSSASTYNWNFGDQNAQSSNTNPMHSFSAPGIYNIRLITSTSSLCVDSITKPVFIGDLPEDLMINNDTLICAGNSFKIRSVVKSDFCLTENHGNSFTGTSDPVVSPLLQTTYTMRAVTPAPSLLVNGNFENGNTGFTSDYLFNATRSGDGQYGITPNAKQWYPGINCFQCGDHTNAPAGNMLMADGAVSANSKIWNSKIVVTPNTTYRVSFWAIAYDAVETARLDLLINNIKAGEWTNMVSEIGLWKPFNILWNSGSADTLDLALLNRNVATSNNRFSIDDIVVAEYKTGIDSFRVDIGPGIPIVAGGDAAICPGAEAELSVSGAANYTWSPALGLSDPGIANPVASPDVTTRYYVRSGNTGTCGGIDSVLVTVKPAPRLSVTPDTSICFGGAVQLNVHGAATYEWSPINGLSNAFIPNPLAKPNETTTYSVLARDMNGCEAGAKVSVYVSPQGKVFVPNAFTPNGDGLNDCFGIRNAQGTKYFELAIYNRFGERVFYSRDPNTCWNGQLNGKAQPSGNFVYYIKMESSCGVVNEKGRITLIR